MVIHNPSLLPVSISHWQRPTYNPLDYLAVAASVFSIVVTMAYPKATLSPTESQKAPVQSTNRLSSRSKQMVSFTLVSLLLPAVTELVQKVYLREAYSFVPADFMVITGLSAVTYLTTSALLVLIRPSPRRHRCRTYWLRQQRAQNDIKEKPPTRPVYCLGIEADPKSMENID